MNGAGPRLQAEPGNVVCCRLRPLEACLLRALLTTLGGSRLRSLSFPVRGIAVPSVGFHVSGERGDGQVENWAWWWVMENAVA